MYKSTLIFTILSLLNLPTFAIDLNETTTTIINEAQEATQLLQHEFETLINEEIVIDNKKTIDNNSSNLTSINITSSMKENNLLEANKSIDENSSNEKEILSVKKIVEINETISINELNNSKKNSCQEENQTTLDSNESNSTTDSDCIEITEVQGSSIHGLIIYKTRIRPYCEMSGESFAKQYMQEDWDDIYYEHEFKNEVIKACPKIEKRYKEKWTPHLYQFALEYASDSDAIPEC